MLHAADCSSRSRAHFGEHVAHLLPPVLMLRRAMLSTLQSSIATTMLVVVWRRWRWLLVFAAITRLFLFVFVVAIAQRVNAGHTMAARVSVYRYV